MTKINTGSWVDLNPRNEYILSVSSPFKSKFQILLSQNSQTFNNSCNRYVSRDLEQEPQTIFCDFRKTRGAKVDLVHQKKYDLSQFH